MFLDLRRFCFNLPYILRCGHSRWLDLLIQLVFFDENPLPTSLIVLFSSSLPLPCPSIFNVDFSMKPVCHLEADLTEEQGVEIKPISLVLFVQCMMRWPTVDQLSVSVWCSNSTDVIHHKQDKDRTDLISTRIWVITNVPVLVRYKHFAPVSLSEYANMNWCDCLADSSACHSTR